MSALAYQSGEKVPGNTRTQPATNGGYPGPGVQVPSMFNLGPFGTGCFLASFVKSQLHLLVAFWKCPQTPAPVSAETGQCVT